MFCYCLLVTCVGTAKWEIVIIYLVAVSLISESDNSLYIPVTKLQYNKCKILYDVQEWRYRSLLYSTCMWNATDLKYILHHRKGYNVIVHQKKINV